MNKTLEPIQHYPAHIQEQVESLINNNRLGKYLLGRYPVVHDINGEKALYNYVQAYKKRYIKQSNPISKVNFDDKIQLVKHALGTHSFVSRVQGNKLKAKQEIRIASLFKQAPQAMLDMIVVHELAHLKEKEHNKAFYKLCCYMLPDYHQLELDTRLFLIHENIFGNLYENR
ncbi:metal-dependent hydrolase [Psychromonas sp. psych-6C06]|uniref:M48 metallopeptidase family protein n=1 Tax=Psychromonas sp. psych-6C06 TaxID=2058089 RepID=UPI000C343F8B|nr:M48 family metallopeptidase [Psychromonas sp. psych-6C06]PKF63814.1 metal-dependent hydrolase [Psychromonas sp. psych-6C06]